MYKLYEISAINNKRYRKLNKEPKYINRQFIGQKTQMTIKYMRYQPNSETQLNNENTFYPIPSNGQKLE